MTADINEHSAISPDHQLPAPVPARPRRKVVRVVMWSLLLLVLALAFVLVLRHHENAQKAASLTRHGATGITITSATAKKGDIGVYLDESVQSPRSIPLSLPVR